MNQEKLIALERLGLTKEEAQEWINRLCGTPLFKTPVPIVYKLKNGYYEALPYFAPSRKDEVFGIAAASVIWPLTGQKYHLRYKDALLEKTRYNNPHLRLPTTYELSEMSSNKVHNTFEFLQSQGIECNEFTKDDDYWSNETVEQWVRVYSFSKYTFHTVDPNKRTGTLRLCIDYYFNEKVK